MISLKAGFSFSRNESILAKSDKREVTLFLERRTSVKMDLSVFKIRVNVNFL